MQNLVSPEEKAVDILLLVRHLQNHALVAQLVRASSVMTSEVAGSSPAVGANIFLKGKLKMTYTISH